MMGKKIKQARPYENVFLRQRTRMLCNQSRSAECDIRLFYFFTPQKILLPYFGASNLQLSLFLRVVELEPQFQILGETIKNAAACCVATDSAGLASPSWAESHLSTGGGG